MCVWLCLVVCFALDLLGLLLFGCFDGFDFVELVRFGLFLILFVIVLLASLLAVYCVVFIVVLGN